MSEVLERIRVSCNKKRLRRRKTALKVLSNYDHVGLLTVGDVLGKDFDFLYEQGWELVSASDTVANEPGVLFFKKIQDEAKDK